MNNVQLKIQELERRTRQALILQEERAQKVGKMFWDAQQAERYPNLSQNLALPTSSDTTLAIDGTEESTKKNRFGYIGRNICKCFTSFGDTTIYNIPENPVSNKLPTKRWYISNGYPVQYVSTLILIYLDENDLNQNKM